MILFSDLHLRDETADLILGTILPELKERALSRMEGVIACLGDVLHFRYKVPVPLLNGLRDWCLDCTGQGLELIFLPGNHDQYDLTGRNALEPLGSIEGVRVYTEPTRDENGLWIPYRKNPSEVRAAISELQRQPRRLNDCADVLFLHHGVRGAWMNDNIQDGEGVCPTEFQAFRQVFTGHYHRHHTVGNVTYIGSPYQTRADESGYEKGFVVWRNGDEFSFITKQWGKRYHRITLAEGQSLDITGIRPGDDVRVSTAAGVDPLVAGKMLDAAGIQTHTVTPEVVVEEQRLTVSEDASLSHYAEAYVELLHEELDPKRLMATYREITS